MSSGTAQTSIEPEARMPMGLMALSALSAGLLGVFFALVCFAALNRNLNVTGVVGDTLSGFGLTSPVLVAVYGLISLLVGGYLAFLLFRSGRRHYAALRPAAGGQTLSELVKIALTMVLILGLFWVGTWLGAIDDLMEEVQSSGFESEGGLVGWALSALLIIVPGLLLTLLLVMPDKIRDLATLAGLMTLLVGGIVYLIFYDLPTLITIIGVCIPAVVIAVYKAVNTRLIRWIALALIIVPILGALALNLQALASLFQALMSGAMSLLLIAVPAVCIALVVLFREKMALRIGMLLITIAVLIGMMFLIDAILKSTDAQASVLADFKEAGGIFWPIYVSIPIALPITLVVALLTRGDRKRVGAQKRALA